MDEDAADVRTDVNIWLADDRGQLLGAWSTCRAAYLPKSAPCEISNHRPIVSLDPMDAVISRAILAKQAKAMEPDWLCAEVVVRGGDVGAHVFAAVVVA